MNRAERVRLQVASRVILALGALAAVFLIVAAFSPEPGTALILMTLCLLGVGLGLMALGEGAGQAAGKPNTASPADGPTLDPTELRALELRKAIEIERAEAELAALRRARLAAAGGATCPRCGSGRFGQFCARCGHRPA